jgi:hypothetical protein
MQQPDDISPVEEERLAIDRIARTRDGVLLHRYLRRILEAVHDLPDMSALPLATGRRTLARDLMRLMADGIEGTSGRSDDSPILTRSGRSGAPTVRTSRRRVLPDPSVDAFLRATAAEPTDEA